MLYLLAHNYRLSIFSLAWGVSQHFPWLACTLACQNRQWSLHRCNCFKWAVSSIQFPFEKKQMSLLLGWEVVCPYLSHLTLLRWNICAVLFCVLRYRVTLIWNVSCSLSQTCGFVGQDEVRLLCTTELSIILWSLGALRFPLAISWRAWSAPWGLDRYQAV